MKDAACLEFTLCFRREARSAAKHHTHHQASQIVVFEMTGDAILDPLTNMIEPMPSTAEDRDQSGISDSSCPIDAFAFEVLPKVEDSRVAISGRPPQSDNNFELVSASDIECIEKLKPLRVVEKLRETRSPSIWPSIDAKYLDVEVDAKPAPFGRPRDRSDEPDGFGAGIRWDRRYGIAKTSANEKYR
jgi:hypothetical protein